MLSSDKNLKTNTSYDLHNQGAFVYLKNIRPPNIFKRNVFSADEIECLTQISTLNDKSQYDPNIEYASLFNQFSKLYEKKLGPFIDSQIKNKKALEEEIKDQIQNNNLNESGKAQMAADQLILSLVDANIKKLDDFVISLIVNDNNHLSYNYESFKDITQNHTPSSESIEKTIHERLNDTFTNLDKKTLSPAQQGSNPVLLTTMLSSTFKPGHDTSLKSVIHNPWNEAQGKPMLLRLGTPAQRHEGEARVDPQHDHFLEAQARANPKKEITHVTINLLGRDRDGFEGEKEKALTTVLEQNENKHSNVAVITLPADKGLMDSSDYEKTQLTLDGKKVKTEFLLIATESPDAQSPIKDFHISERIRTLLFVDETGQYSKISQDKMVNTLLENSYKALGIDENNMISPAQRQALWFHFIKFELTNHIITTLNPITFNIDCKDGIDRGGAHRAYFNVLKNIEHGKPMSQDAFQEALHAASAGIKGRGMNHHRNLIWNALDAYINQNYESIKKNEDTVWMIQWRDMNCPIERAGCLLGQRIDVLLSELKAAKPGQAINEAIPILQQIKTLKDTSGNRLLLETALRIQAFALNPTNELGERGSVLADKIEVEYPVLTILAGQIKIFIGHVLLKLSIDQSMENYSKDTIKKGAATVKKGEKADQRNSLQSDMKNFLANFKQADKQKNTVDEQQKNNNIRQI